MQIKVEVNGESHVDEVEPRLLLGKALRDRLGQDEAADRQVLKRSPRAVENGDVGFGRPPRVVAGDHRSQRDDAVPVDQPREEGGLKLAQGD